MNNKMLAQKIIETIDNFRLSGDSEREVVDAVESYLDLLTPKNKEAFGKWGYTNEKECKQ